jgi:integrase
MCFFVNGKKVRKSTKTTNKKVAQRIYEKARVEAAEGKFFINERSKMPFDQLVNEFIEKHSKVEKESFKDDISAGKRVTAYFKQTPIGKITPYDLKSWRQWRKQHIARLGKPISKSALNREFTFLKTMFNLALEWGWLPENPARLMKNLKGETSRMRFLKREEIHRLIDCAAPNLKPVIITAVSTGMRRGEIFNLEWKDVDFENGFIKVEKTKNKERRDVPIDAYLSETLKGLTESRKKGEFVFLQKKRE